MDPAHKYEYPAVCDEPHVCLQYQVQFPKRASLTDAQISTVYMYALFKQLRTHRSVTSIY